MYNWSLAVWLFYIVELSLAVPITNSLTFLFTILSGWCLGDKIRHWGKYQAQNAADMFFTSHCILHEFEICVLTIEKHLHVLLDLILNWEDLFWIFFRDLRGNVVGSSRCGSLCVRQNVMKMHVACIIIICTL